MKLLKQNERKEKAGHIDIQRKKQETKETHAVIPFYKFKSRQSILYF